MGRSKHAPLRTCVSCRAVRPKADLVRVVASPEGGVRTDATGKLPGRGAYFCRDRTCLDDRRGPAALQRALKAPVTEAAWQHLVQEIASQICEAETGKAAQRDPGRC